MGNLCLFLIELRFLDRYEHFVRNGLQTHLTTNLDLSEIDTVYGSRVASRMHEMFNFVILVEIKMPKTGGYANNIQYTYRD